MVTYMIQCLAVLGSSGSLMVEQMLVKGMVVSSNLTMSVGFPTGLTPLPTLLQAES